jgi:DNA-binding NarL/FixJ family response regulator
VTVILPKIKILVVEDYEPFRRFVVSALQERDEFLVTEAFDGLQAVQAAEEHQPDLILLDIGLPKLNGLKAAVRIRKTAPHSRILFVSQERSFAVVQHALHSGALGYVHKTRIPTELLPAIESVLAGRQFVSSGLEVREFTEPTNAQAANCHEVQFYSEDAVFLASVADFIASALKAGNPAIVMATKSHREGLIRRLTSDGFDIDAAIHQGTYISLDAADMLSRIMVGGQPDGVRFSTGLSNLIQQASEAAKTEHPRIALCGECVGLLCEEGNANAAIQLEKVGNKLIKTHDVDILCAYPLSVFHGDEQRHLFDNVCKEHSAVRIG